MPFRNSVKLKMTFNKEPMVSIIIPIYNAASYLPSCLESVVDQSYGNLQIILVDDGSNDGSRDICKQWEKKDARITTIVQPNSGAAVARNTALDQVEGEWLLFIDADDIVMPWHVDVLLDTALEAGVDIVAGGYRTFFENVSDGVLISPKRDKVVDEASAILEMMLYQEGIDTSPWGKIYRWDSFSDVRFPNVKSSEDLATVYKAFLNATTAAAIKDCGYRYRHVAGSLSYSEKEEGSWFVARDLALEVESIYPNLRKACDSRRLSHAFHVMPLARRDDVIERLWGEILNTRISVVKDSRARKKVRIAAISSFLGKGATYRFSKIAHSKYSR